MHSDSNWNLEPKTDVCKNKLFFLPLEQRFRNPKKNLGEKQILAFYFNIYFLVKHKLPIK